MAVCTLGAAAVTFAAVRVWSSAFGRRITHLRIKSGVCHEAPYNSLSSRWAASSRTIRSFVGFSGVRMQGGACTNDVDVGGGGDDVVVVATVFGAFRFFLPTEEVAEVLDVFLDTSFSNCIGLRLLRGVFLCCGSNGRSTFEVADVSEAGICSSERCDVSEACCSSAAICISDILTACVPISSSAALACELSSARTILESWRSDVDEAADDDDDDSL